MKRLYTLADAADARYASKAREDAKWDAIEAREHARAIVLANNPHIGKLIRNGKPVYYVTSPSYRESREPSNLLEKTA